jgi:hypothetical protein
LNYDVRDATFMSKPSWKNQLMRVLMVDSVFHSGMKYSDKKGGKYCHFLSKCDETTVKTIIVSRSTHEC